MNKLQVHDISPKNITIVISKRSQTHTHTKMPTWFHLYKQLKHEKLIYGFKSQNHGQKRRNYDWEGKYRGLLCTDNALFSRSGLWFHECAYLVKIHQAIH